MVDIPYFASEIHNLFLENTYNLLKFVRIKQSRRMDHKLTVKLNRQVIQKAKSYAKRRHTSLSRLIERYLATLSSPEGEAFPISPLVQSLSGILRLPPESPVRKLYTDHLSRKYR